MAYVATSGTVSDTMKYMGYAAIGLGALLLYTIVVPKRK